MPACHQCFAALPDGTPVPALCPDCTPKPDREPAVWIGDTPYTVQSCTPLPDGSRLYTLAGLHHLSRPRTLRLGPSILKPKDPAP